MSSTTANTALPASSDPFLSGARSTQGTLSAEEQDALLDLLQRGASPIGACQQVGITLEEFWATVNHNARFEAVWQRAFDGLSHNVVSQLYMAAMKGNVTAQQFWLRQRPATHWSTADKDDRDPLEQLNDAQLFDTCRATGVDIPPEIEARMGAPDRRA